MQVDPLADKYPGWSPYNYCLNNPVSIIDPHGDTVKILNEEIKAGHDAAYNKKDADGNYINTQYRTQYDLLNASDVVYNVINGDLGGNNGGTITLGDFGTTDGKEVTITLDMKHGATIGGELSHEFGHGVQFEKNEISFGFKDGKWWTQNTGFRRELAAFEGQQDPPKWTEYSLAKKIGMLNILYKGLNNKSLESVNYEPPLTNPGGQLIIRNSTNFVIYPAK